MYRLLPALHHETMVRVHTGRGMLAAPEAQIVRGGITATAMIITLGTAARAIGLVPHANPRVGVTASLCLGLAVHPMHAAPRTHARTAGWPPAPLNGRPAPSQARQATSPSAATPRLRQT